MTRQLLFVASLALMLSGCGAARQFSMPAPAPAAPFEFTILQLNDVYEIAPLEGGRVAGLARVATLLRQLEAENPHTIAVMAGDFLSPSYMGTLKLENGESVAGLQMVETLNTMGLDYATFGNHEFDLKTADLLASRIEQSQFKYVVCNAQHWDGTQAKPFVQHGQPVPSYAIHRFAHQGQTISVGLLGVVLPFNQANYVEYLPVTESFAAAYRLAQTQTDVVIALTHQSIDEDEDLARAVPGIPLFIGGHEHENLSRYVENTAITKADANAKTVYVHRVRYDPTSGFTQVRSTLVPIDSTLAFEPATQAVVDAWQARVDAIVRAQGYQPDRVLAQALSPLEGTEAAVRNRQTNFGGLANRAFADLLPAADVYLLNGGSLRLDDNLVGPITEYDILRTFPFGGPIVRVQWDGATLARVLDIGAHTNRGEGGYLQRLQAEPNPAGGWLVGGQPLDPNHTYTAVLPQFVAQGKEANLGFLADFPFTAPETFSYQGQTVRNDIRDILMAYLLEVKEVR